MPGATIRTIVHNPEVERLKAELDRARRTVLDLMPDNIRDVLYSYRECASRQESWRWREGAAEQLIGLAQPLQSARSRDRASCPLCKGGSSSPYEEGFSLPEGLRRHLVGWGNSFSCPVMTAAYDLAREWAHDKFHDDEMRERAEAQAEIDRRKQTETLYQIGPDRDPELMRVGDSWHPARGEEGLAWAEDRLEKLGFKKTLEGRVKSYAQEHDTFIVYADPREEGRIDFVVYTLPLPRRPRSPRQPFRMRPRFKVMDTWKHDIDKKYAARLKDALGIRDPR